MMKTYENIKAKIIKKHVIYTFLKAFACALLITVGALTVASCVTNRPSVAYSTSGTSFEITPTDASTQTPQPPTQIPDIDEIQAKDSEYTGKIIISEICPKNEAGIIDASGRFSDWIEITNISNEQLTLKNVSLTNSEAQKNKYLIPDVTVKAGGSILIFASGDNSGSSASQSGDSSNTNSELHAPFKLSSEGETIYLYQNGDILLDKMTYANASEDHSYYKDTYQGKIKETCYTTPGCPSTAAGYEACCASNKNPSPLAVSELQVSNDSLLEQSDGKYYDWAEILNTSNDTVLLSDYYITDKLGKVKYTLPDIKLGAGGYFIIICSGTEKFDRNGYYHAGFALNAESEAFYICRKSDNALIDWVHIEKVPYGASLGRNTDISGGFYYFTKPTPGLKNTDGYRQVCYEAESTTAEGIYEEDVTVGFEADGDIYYTLDGSEPDLNSARYTKPLSLSSTTVIRTLVHMEGSLDSCIKTYSYIISENTTLPVLSLVTESDNLWSDETGIYVEGNYTNYYQDWERFASLSYFDGNGEGFNINCGLKMNGEGSRASDDKKSFKVIFRGKYGKSELKYDIFGNGTDTFDSLVLRAGEDYKSSIIRNELMTTLAVRYFPSVIAQTGKYCMLYINGDFFGIYYLQERFTEAFFAEHFGVSEESVLMSEFETSGIPELYNVINFTDTHDMSLDENYKYIDDRIDIESMTDWFILEAYCGNTDVSGNIRYYKSPEKSVDEASKQNNGKWKWVFYDLDWSFYGRSEPFEKLILSNMGDTNLIIRALLRENAAYREYFISRLSYHMNNTLTDENILAIIDEYVSALEPQIERERAKWGGSKSGWEQSITALRSYIVDYDRAEELMSSINNVLAQLSS